MSEMVERVAENSLLHEIIHAAYEQGGLEDEDKEERVVVCLSNQLTQVWRDNSDFVAFMSEALTPT